MFPSIAIVAAFLGAHAELPVVTLDRDNVVIDRSCRVVVPKGRVIADADGNGVVHVRASDISVLFDGESGPLRGAERGTPWEALEGIGVVVEGQRGVRLRGARIHGYKVGILARGADGLVVEDCDVSDGFAERLGSTPEAEDAGDWLRPHENDGGEWRERYGAGIAIEDSEGVVVRGCTARRRQNGLILDRVRDSEISDNDFSFLSGWGIAMWRSSGNRIHHNACDFCVRGYSHGVYNRGQDSAGILLFEQCSENWLIRNSATHGGDGIFAFAGEEALRTEGRAGNNANVFSENDLSYAAAHGLELTFSFDNYIRLNRFVGNAICGVWGGYSQHTIIAHNTFERNGDAGYGLERGGVNIEHGADNLISHNTFIENAVGVHLWEDDDPHLLSRPWAKHNHRGAVGNVIWDNEFRGDGIAVRLRGARETGMKDNRMIGVGKEVEAAPGSEPVEAGPIVEISYRFPELAEAETSPVGARAALRGRENIILGEYFPWDHEGPMLRPLSREPARHRYELFGVRPPFDVERIEGEPDLGVYGSVRPGARTIEVSSARPGVHPYRVRVGKGDFSRELRGTLVRTNWRVRAFAWEADPRTDEAAWRDEAKGVEPVETKALHFPFGSEGPAALGLVAEGGMDPGADRFGVIATTRLRLPAGRWRFRTRSDDGVRVRVDGTPVIENWTHHAPTTDEGTVELKEEREVAINVEHFELDGWSVLTLDIGPAD